MRGKRRKAKRVAKYQHEFVEKRRKLMKWARAGFTNAGNEKRITSAQVMIKFLRIQEQRCCFTGLPLRIEHPKSAFFAVLDRKNRKEPFSEDSTVIVCRLFANTTAVWSSHLCNKSLKTVPLPIERKSSATRTIGGLRRLISTMNQIANFSEKASVNSIRQSHQL